VDYRTLGRSGCAVSVFGLGTMTFGVETEEPEAHRQLDRFLGAGGTLVDTADTYGTGRSEEIIGRWFASRPAEVTGRVVLATKGRFPLDADPNGAGLSARHLTRALDASLRRLGLDAVDLYQAHAFDPWTPLEETLRTMDGFVRARTTAQLEANLRAAGLRLTAQETAELDAASDPGAPDYPYGEMGAEQRSRSLADGR
jgi:aryl-alcohol dehydrogenase-like predicted oxidoreductase